MKSTRDLIRFALVLAAFVSCAAASVIATGISS